VKVRRKGTYQLWAASSPGGRKNAVPVALAYPKVNWSSPCRLSFVTRMKRTCADDVRACWRTWFITRINWQQECGLSVFRGGWRVQHQMALQQTLKADCSTW
jgi:hypothetical protein